MIKPEYCQDQIHDKKDFQKDCWCERHGVPWWDAVCFFHLVVKPLSHQPRSHEVWLDLICGARRTPTQTAEQREERLARRRSARVRDRARRAEQTEQRQVRVQLKCDTTEFLRQKIKSGSKSTPVGKELPRKSSHLTPYWYILHRKHVLSSLLWAS